MSLLVIVLALAVLGVLLVWGRWGIVRIWRGRDTLERVAVEDALKHIHAQEVQGRFATPESVAGALGIPLAEAMQHLVTMDRRGLIRHVDSGLALTDEGRALARQVIRAHRLLERYFADELRMPVDALHAAADRHEHALSPADATALDAHLGYPRRDPHGDPIPTAAGTLADSEGTSLRQWPSGVPARIVHLEDEPADVFREIATSGLKLGLTVEIVARMGQHVTLWDGDREYIIPARAAENVFVSLARRPPLPSARLSDLIPGESATVSDLECEGFGRRRLLDLGVTPGTRIDCLFAGLGPEPLAYRIRGAVIALRRDQAADIIVERMGYRAAEKSVPSSVAEARS